MLRPSDWRGLIDFAPGTRFCSRYVEEALAQADFGAAKPTHLRCPTDVRQSSVRQSSVNAK